MNTTYPDYINNPAIIGRSLSQYKVLARDYKERLDAVLVREAGRITYRQYKDDDDNYYIHMKVPSEVVPKFYYDVIVKFKKSVINRFKSTLNDYDVQFFSNDPAFCFTYSYAFNKNKLLIEDFASKIGKDFLEHKAVTMNPKNSIGPVKSLYFAYYIMQNKKLFDKKNWEKTIPYKASSLLKNIMKAEEKIHLRQRYQKAIQHREKQSNPTAIPTPIQQSTPLHITKASGTIKYTKTAKVTKRAKTVKKK